MPSQRNTIVVALALALSCLAMVSVVSAVSCKGPNGDVAWFFVHKTPINPVDGAQGTHKWGYRDATTDLTYVDYSVGAGGGKAVRDTLTAVMGSAHKIIYNDQTAAAPDDKQNNGGAHEKGWLGWNTGESAAYLIHSVPNWSSNIDIPSDVNGQSFMCITVPSANVVDVLKALLNAQVIVRAGCADPHSSGVAEATNLCKNTWPANAFTKVDIVLADTTQFRLYSKGPSFPSSDKQKEIWTAIAVDLTSCLTVSTWEKLTPGCSTGPNLAPMRTAVNDVNKVSIVQAAATIAKYEGIGDKKRDHSKLGFVSEDGKDPWVCVGGNNRNKAQYSRGGLALCKKDATLRTALKANTIVTNPRACSFAPPPPPEPAAEDCPVGEEDQEGPVEPANKKARPTTNFRQLFLRP